MLKKIKNIRLNMEKREALAGYLFCLPFILGFIFMVLYPFVQSIIFSLNRLEIKPDGYELVFIQLENYHRALFVNAEFRGFWSKRSCGCSALFRSLDL